VIDVIIGVQAFGAPGQQCQSSEIHWIDGRHGCTGWGGDLDFGLRVGELNFCSCRIVGNLCMHGVI
jgi:hypothetical protein